jgi:hypothetical protein
MICSTSNYMLAVVALALSLQQPAFAFSSLVQQVFPLAHFFFFPLSAIATPVTIKNAVANKSTFFIIIFFVELINKRKNKAEIAANL